MALKNYWEMLKKKYFHKYIKPIAKISSNKKNKHKDNIDLRDHLLHLIKISHNGKFLEFYENQTTRSLPYSVAYNKASRYLSGLLKNNFPKKQCLVICTDDFFSFIPIAWACILGNYSFFPLLFDREKTINQAKWLSEMDNNIIIIASESAYNFFLEYKFISSNCLIKLSSLEEKSSLEEEPPFYISNNSECEILVTTSGTSGYMKVARLSYTSIAHRLDKRSEELPIISLDSFPLQSISGLITLFPEANTSIYIDPKIISIKPYILLQTIERTKTPYIRLSPHQVFSLCHTLASTTKSYNLSHLSHIYIGSDFIDYKNISSFVKIFSQYINSNCKISFTYGMTECGPIISTTKHFNNILEVFDEKKLLPALTHCADTWNIRITNKGKTLLEEEVGNIEVCSPSKLFSGYFNINNHCFSNDGWFKTGDRGFIKNGNLYLSGRNKNRIYVGNKKVETEDIELKLQAISGMPNNRIYIKKVRSSNNLNDEIEVFIAVNNNKKLIINSIKNNIQQCLYECFDIYAKKIYVVSVNDLPKTKTGKVIRSKLSELKNENIGIAIHENIFSEDYIERTIQLEWIYLLNLIHPPKPNDNFHILGGDSLALSSLVSYLEYTYSIVYDIDILIKNLKFKNLVSLTKCLHSEKSTSNITLFEDEEKNRIRKIRIILSSWKGNRKFKNSLIVARNINGNKLPIFWVFQSETEFNNLANALGENQPIYGMKSYSGIMKINDYSIKTISGIVNIYLSEILSLSTNCPILIGGNCQAGMIALELSRRLISMGKVPKKLILMEWMYKLGHYKYEVLFLYGEDSHSSSIYIDNNPDIRWKEYFPKHKVLSIRGEHGDFFMKENIPSLVAILKDLSLLDI